MADVLLIEPNPVMSLGLNWLLRQSGHSLLAELEGGQHVAAVLQQRPPQAVILELNLPDADGYEVLRQVRAASAGARVIVATAAASSAAVRRCRQLGADVFLAKPLRPRLIVSALAELEGRAEAPEEE